MKYHITLTRNDVLDELAISRFPCSLDDFNEPCTAVIVKKKNWHAKFLYLRAMQVLFLIYLNDSTLTKIYSCQILFLKKRF